MRRKVIEMPERIFSEGVVLPDGRKVRVLAYDDDSVRFRLDGTPYVLEEAFLSGGRQDHAIIKLARRSAASVAADVEDEGGDPMLVLRAKVAALKEGLDNVPEAEGSGRIVTRHWRKAMNASFTVTLLMIDEILAADPDAE
jgi:hypothetical protein